MLHRLPPLGLWSSRICGRKLRTVAAWLSVLLCGLPALRAQRPASAPAPEVIRVAMDDNYPPFAFRDEQGRLRGVTVDQWALWEKQTGVKVELHAMRWGDALRLMREGRFDVIDTIFRSKERENQFDFSAPYQTIEVSIFFERNIGGIADLESLRGFPVAVKEGDFAADQLRDAGVTTRLLYPNYASIVQAAADRKINVFVMDAPAALHHLCKLGLSDTYRQSEPINQGQLHRAVAKGRTDLLRLVETGFAAIPKSELRRIDERWFGRGLETHPLLRHAVWVLVGAGGLILLLVVWNRLLQRLVARRTASLQQSEEHLAAERNFISAVVDSAGVLVVVLDRDGRICRFNREAERVSGYRAEEVVGTMPWEQLIPPDEAGRVRQEAFDARWESRAPMSPVRHTNHWVNKAGERRLIEWFNTLVHDSGGRPRHMVAVGLDITERKELEEQFLRSQRMEALGSMVGGIAHDLNNIFAPVLLISERLKELIADPALTRQLDILRNCAQRGAGVIRQLLTFSRGEGDERRPTSPEVLLNEIAGIVRETFPRELICEARCAPDLPEIRISPNRIHQVLLNLCVNARDAMPGGGVLTLSADRVTFAAGDAGLPCDARPGEYVRFLVEDTGIGMPPDVVRQIFTPFFTTKDAGKGTGLGLSTVKGIVGAHAGFVRVESTPGLGSTFEVCLPLQTSAGDTAPPAAGPAAAEAAAHPILIVDDEPALRETFQAVLNLRGFQTLTAADGEEALRRLEETKGRVSLVITDVMMPGMDGVSLISAVRQRHPRLKVMAMSGMVPEAIERRLEALGIRGILRKPFHVDQTVAAIRETLAAA